MFCIQHHLKQFNYILQEVLATHILKTNLTIIISCPTLQNIKLQLPDEKTSA
jgi:hypothetical protein